MSGTSSNGIAGAARDQDFGEGFAEVLARAAALPDLSREDFETTEDFVDAHIRAVVDRSVMRLRFPEPDRGGRTCDLSEHAGLRGPRMEVKLGNGKSHTLRLGALLSHSAESPEPLMLLAKTSEEAYTVLFRTCRGLEDPWAELVQARDEAEELVRSLAEDVGRRRSQTGPWQLSLALVAPHILTSPTSTARVRCQWWTGSILEEDFRHLLYRADEPGARAAEPASPLHADPGADLKLFNLCRVAGQTSNETWHWHCPRSEYPDLQRVHAPSAGRLRSAGQLLLSTRDWLMQSVYGLVHRADQAALRMRLPQPPPAETSEVLPTRRPRVRVLVDRELASVG